MKATTHPAVTALLAASLWVMLGAVSITMPQANLDAGWQSVLVHGWVEGWRWGVDLIDNFGPYGFLYGREYHPDAIVAMLVLSGAMTAVFVVAWLHFIEAMTTAAKWLLSIGLAMAPTDRHETLFFAFPILLAFISRVPPRDRGDLAIRVLLVVAIALAAEVKWTFFVLGAAVLFLLDMEIVLRRRWPWHLPVGMAAFAAFHGAAGQHFADFSRLVALTSNQTAGFPDAMALPGPLWELWAFPAAAGVAAILLYLSLAPAPLVRRVIIWLAICGALFVAFKAGFVRHDAIHTRTSWSTLYLVFAGCWVISAGVLAARSRAMAAAGGVAALALTVHFQSGTTADWLAFSFRDRPLEDIVTLADLTHPEAWKAAQTARWEDARASIRDMLPLGSIAGSVDALPPLQSNILAWSLDYRPRPTMQEHQAYTRRILAEDEAFFASERGPDNVIFLPGSIDARYPSLIEAPVWPVLLAHYRVDSRIGDYLVLKRRAVPAAPFVRGPPRSGTIGWQDPLQLLADESAAAFVTLKFEPSPLGRIVAFLHRPPIVWLVVTFADGRVSQYRLPRGLAESGFLLSPLVATANDYEAFAAGDLAAPAANRIASFALAVEGDRRTEFEPEIAYDLQPVAPSAAPVASAPGRGVDPTPAPAP